MQISKETHNQMTTTISTLERELRLANTTIRTLETANHTFDEILDKIVRAARGLELIVRHSDGTYGYSLPMHAGMYTNDGGHQCTPPTPEQIQARMIDDLFARQVELEKKLAAVIAVATFAKEHKA